MSILRQLTCLTIFYLPQEFQSELLWPWSVHMLQHNHTSRLMQHIHCLCPSFYAEPETMLALCKQKHNMETMPKKMSNVKAYNKKYQMATYNKTILVVRARPVKSFSSANCQNSSQLFQHCVKMCCCNLKPHHFSPFDLILRDLVRAPKSHWKCRNVFSDDDYTSPCDFWSIIGEHLSPDV